MGKVVEIATVKQITRLPATPAWLRGIVHHRGQPLLVVDLAQRLAQRGHTPTALSRIVIVRTASDGFVGLLADAVDNILELRVADTEPVVRPSECLAGVARLREESVWILDPDRTLEEMPTVLDP
jgi:purine-binding chemotaxis protein CheW